MKKEKKYINQKLESINLGALFVTPCESLI
jgi:hypothetical protein